MTKEHGGDATTIAEVKHPAKYTKQLLPTLAYYLIGYKRIIDPFAGVGTVFELYDYWTDQIKAEQQIFAIELEPEWANSHPQVIVGNALHLEYPNWFFDAAVTSPAYGNRMADKKSPDGKWKNTRIGYAEYLGRDLSKDNAGGIPWGDKYRQFHECAWSELDRVVSRRVIINVKNHYRNYKEQMVSEWHRDFFVKQLGYTLTAHEMIKVPSMRKGRNHELRVEYENIYVLDK